jgi:heptosyltransferase-2
MERVPTTAQQAGRPLTEVFADAVGVELTRPQVELKLPRAVEAAGEPSMVPLIGLAVGESGSMRSYPQPMLSELVSQLVRRGLGVVLLGHADPSWSVPVCPPVITDMRSRTPTVIELAVWLRAVDVVVCHDSFVMHIAGALQRPTVALFAPTSEAHARPYGGTLPMASTAECAPCHAATGACPRGLDRCIAWDDPRLQPEALATLVLEHLGRHGRHVQGDGHGFAAAL